MEHGPASSKNIDLGRMTLPMSSFLRDRTGREPETHEVEASCTPRATGHLATCQPLAFDDETLCWPPRGIGHDFPAADGREWEYGRPAREVEPAEAMTPSEENTPERGCIDK